MAKIAWSPLVMDARGTVGGVTFTLTQWGNTARIWHPPHQPYTTLQLLQRGQFASLSQLWKDPSMTPYRIGWISLALANPYYDVFHNLRHLTGLAMFQKCNRTLQTLGQSSILIPPATLSCGSPTSLTAAHDSGPPNTLLVTPFTNPAPTEAVIIRATPPLSPGITRLGNTQSILKVINPGVAGPWDVYAEYHAKHPLVASGQQVFILLNYATIATGFQGDQFSASLIW